MSSTTGAAVYARCVVSIMRGPQLEGTALGTALHENKRQFCELCGYTCLLTNRTFSTRGPVWDKVLALLEAMPLCNVSFWVDHDVVFLRPYSPKLTTAVATAGSAALRLSLATHHR